MQIRRATDVDRETLRELWLEFAGPLPPWAEGGAEETFAELDRAIAEGTAALAEDDGEPIGFASALRRNERVADLTELYVRPPARRAGTGTALARTVLEAVGAEFVRVGVGVGNQPARALYQRLGFRPEQLILRLDAAGQQRVAGGGRSFGSIHIQSDDTPAVERAVRQFVPRLPGRSRGSIVAPPRNGWIAVYDDVCDRDPKQLRRLARELSDRMGAVVLALGVEEGAVVRFVLLDRGGIVDEYLSVQEYYGPLPPGDVIALAANPTVVSRLTGADPAAIRAAAVHAPSPADLPPPYDTLAELARVVGIAGAEHGYADAPEIPGAITIERR
jgi:ribosomal protein S18 acetylase RimI-like enzyme